MLMLKKDHKLKTTAEVTFIIDGKEIHCEGEENGPVNALDNAIRSNFKKVEKYYKYFSDLKLLDYKVRILNTGTGATTRVSIESTDKTGKSWFTIGVSQNIIEASFKALIDSLEYKLFKEKAPANIHENKYGFILIQPQLGENIGASARSLKNFGFDNLIITNPKQNWPNIKAKATSVGAYDILKKTKVFNNTISAIKNFDMIFSFSARKRNINKNI